MKYITCVVLMIFALTGCGDRYSEGDDKAAQTFQLMSGKEKAIMSEVEEQWGEKVLQPIRDAIRKNREIPADEKQLAFVDVSDVVRTVNEVSLVIEGGNYTKETIEKKYKNKFSSLDPEWYRQLTGKIFEEEAPIHLATPEKEKVNVDEIVANLENEEIKVNDTPTEVISVEFNNGEMRDFHRYVDRLVSSCPEALDYLNGIVSEGRGLRSNDYDVFLNFENICETRKIAERYGS